MKEIRKLDSTKKNNLLLCKARLRAALRQKNISTPSGRRGCRWRAAGRSCSATGQGSHAGLCCFVECLGSEIVLSSQIRGAVAQCQQTAQE